MNIELELRRLACLYFNKLRWLAKLVKLVMQDLRRLACLYFNKLRWLAKLVKLVMQDSENWIKNYSVTK
jgi:hypothetical protein